MSNTDVSNTSTMSTTPRRGSDKVAQRKKELFLERFAACGNVSQACRESGVPRRTVYGWLQDANDEAFAAAYAEAEQQALDALVEEVRRRATGFDVVEETSEIL